MQDQVAEQIAAQLLAIKAVKLNVREPFTWASGLQSPIYCDYRKTLSYPAVRTFIKECLVATVQQNFPEVGGIVGVVTAGIPQGALVAEVLQLPFLYARSDAKDHGLKNNIEGVLTNGQKLVVLEDLISTGRSSLQVCKALQAAGAKVLGVLTIFSYGLNVAKENFQKAHLPLFSLSNYNMLIQKAEEQGYITQKAMKSLKDWQKAPENWGKGKIK